MDDLGGYSGRALRFLKEQGAAVGDVLEVETEWGTLTGTLVPRYEYGDDAHVVIKLKSGYNVGLETARLKGAKVTAKGERPAFKPPAAPKASSKLPRVAVLSTGGTIASRIDYRTGAVRPATSAGELLGLIPELAERARVEPEILLSISSENMDAAAWETMAGRAAKAVADGVAGVVITQGTDTLGYSAAAMSFALAGVPIPVVLVGAQRSSDRPSSDATLNLTGAVAVAAEAPFSGVYVVMHHGSSDDRLAVHTATRVRKDHTSARGAFESIGVPPAAFWTRDGLSQVRAGLPPRGRSGFAPQTRFSDKVALVKHHPSMSPVAIDALRRSGMVAIVVEGTGLGHVNDANVKALRAFVKGGGSAFMTSQCINGRVNMNVYDVGRDLLSAGVIPLEDMLAETALAKAMWAFANASSPKEARDWMVSDLQGETTQRRLGE